MSPSGHSTGTHSPSTHLSLPPGQLWFYPFHSFMLPELSLDKWVLWLQKMFVNQKSNPSPYYLGAKTEIQKKFPFVLLSTPSTKPTFPPIPPPQTTFSLRPLGMGTEFR